uniref:Uncharacterized protein n=1 Tax=Engystomops pustulosus TaxID=76066 RepID=A0AAV6YSU9_ENGPU|nr:hypothetical protein GDO81_021271 [Engystomops pustulosus]
MLHSRVNKGVFAARSPYMEVMRDAAVILTPYRQMFPQKQRLHFRPLELIISFGQRSAIDIPWAPARRAQPKAEGNLYFYICLYRSLLIFFGLIS